MLRQNQKMQNGRYSIIKTSRKKGIGITYEAFDVELRTNVLLKEVPENVSKEMSAEQLESSKNDFARKSERLRKINHNSLINIQGYFSESGNHYLVGESTNGDNLSKQIEATKKPFPLPNVVRWTGQLLDAISFLHSQSPPIIHRDIKPEYLNLNADGSVKLSSLNIIQHSDLKKYAISEDELFESTNLAFSPLEQLWDGLDSASKNVILNNFDEQSQKILEQPADARSDIYSLGATLYFLLTAEMPLDSLSRQIDILDGADDPIKPPHKINSKVPEEISEVVMKALEIKREDRFNSMAIMKQVFRTSLHKLKAEAKAKKPPRINQEAKTPLSIPENKKEEPQPKPIPGEAKRQLELIKKQLREAEERRRAAEKRANEAERLLLKQSKFKSNPPLIPVSKVESSNPKTEVSLISESHSTPRSNANQIPEALQKPKVEFGQKPKIETNETNDEIEEDFSPMPAKKVSEIDVVQENVIGEDSASYFEDLYEQEHQQKESSKPLLKIAAAAVALLVIGSVAWGAWSFYNSNSVQTDQLITSDEKVPPVTAEENTPVPTPEMTEVVPVEETDLENPTALPETDESQETADYVEPTPNAPIQNRATQTVPPPRVNRVPRKSGTAVARPVRQAAAKTPAPKPKPTKKSVTLDDLLRDN